MLLAIFEQRDWATQTAVDSPLQEWLMLKSVRWLGQEYSLLTGALSAL
jgi:hypothetical protein